MHQHHHHHDHDRRHDGEPHRRHSDRRTWRRRIGTGIVIAAVGYLASTCVVFVDETEFAYITRFGARVAVVTQAGPVFKLPWPIDRIRRRRDGFDRRLQIYEMPGREGITQDKKVLTVAAYVCWRIDPESVDRFFKTVGTISAANSRLDEFVSGRLWTAIGRRRLDQLIHPANDADQGQRTELESMLTELTDSVRDTARQFGISVVDIRLKRLNYPSEVRPAIYERIRSERNRYAVQYRSEGDSEAQKIRSRADLEREKLLADAEAEATRVRGKADADKTRILNEAHAKDPEFYSLLRTFEAYRKILDDKTTLVLSTDNAIFRLLTKSAAPTAVPGGNVAGQSPIGPAVKTNGPTGNSPANAAGPNGRSKNPH
jgi:membrane protease subunit HflC